MTSRAGLRGEIDRFATSHRPPSRCILTCLAVTRFALRLQLGPKNVTSQTRPPARSSPKSKISFVQLRGRGGSPPPAQSASSAVSTERALEGAQVDFERLDRGARAE